MLELVRAFIKERWSQAFVWAISGLISFGVSSYYVHIQTDPQNNISIIPLNGEPFDVCGIKYESLWSEYQKAFSLENTTPAASTRYQQALATLYETVRLASVPISTADFLVPIRENFFGGLKKGLSDTEITKLDSIVSCSNDAQRKTMIDISAVLVMNQEKVYTLKRRCKLVTDEEQLPVWLNLSDSNVEKSLSMQDDDAALIIKETRRIRLRYDPFLGGDFASTQAIDNFAAKLKSKPKQKHRLQIQCFLLQDDLSSTLANRLQTFEFEGASLPEGDPSEIREPSVFSLFSARLSK